MPFINSKKTVGFKIEGTPYSVEALAAPDYDFRAMNVSYTPEIEAMVRKYATGDYSVFTSIMGKKKIVISFSVHMAWSGTATVAPEWGKLIKACGFAETVLAGGVRYLTSAETCSVPATIEVQELKDSSTNALVLTARGSMGNVSLNVDNTGEVVRMDFEFTGVLHDVADRDSGDIITPGNFDATDPDPVMGSTLTAFTVAQPINTVAIDAGNAVEMYIDPASNQGYRGAYVVNRDSTIALDPYLDLEATNPWYTRWSGGSSGPFSMTVGSNITISAPKMQAITAFPAGERGGFSTNAISGILTRDAGNDELKILQGVE